MKKTCVVLRSGIALFLIFTFCLLPCLSLTASATEFPAVVGASNAYLYNFESDRVLICQSSGGLIAPGATVKIMSGLLALRLLEGRQEEQVTITNEMLFGVEGYTIRLEAGMTLKIRDLLYGLICGGGNDAAHVLAVLSCGSVEAFVEQMNAQARDWGCTQTNYANPTGIDDPRMVTTLADTVTIANKAIENETFMEMCSIASYAYTLAGAEDSTVFYNRNAQISTYTGEGYQNRFVKGLNAGMTDRSGYCVVSYATNGTERYLCIIMGALKTSAGIMSYVNANNLLNRLFSNYSYQQIAKKNDVVYSAPIQNAQPQRGTKQPVVSCVLTEDLYGFVPQNINTERDLEYRFYFHEDELGAPITKGTILGGVDVYLSGEWITGCPIAAAKDIEASFLLLFLSHMKTFFLSRGVLLSALFFIILLSTYLYYSSKKRKRKQIKTIMDIGGKK